MPPDESSKKRHLFSVAFAGGGRLLFMQMALCDAYLSSYDFFTFNTFIYVNNGSTDTVHTRLFEHNTLLFFFLSILNVFY